MEAAHLPWQHLGSLLINRGLLDNDRGIWSNRRGGYITEAEHIADEKSDSRKRAWWLPRVGK